MTLNPTMMETTRKTTSDSSDTGVTTNDSRGKTLLPRPLFIVFCRICGVESMPTDQLAAAQHVLLTVCSEAEQNQAFRVWKIHSSVYGRFLACLGAAPALDASQQILSQAAAQGLHLVIGIAGDGRVEWFDDLGMKPNLIGVPINTAARLAFTQDSENSIVVEDYVVREAQDQREDYKERFAKQEREQVKETRLAFRRLKFSADKFGSLPKKAELPDTQVSVAVYDIVGYSKMDLENAWNTVDALRREVVKVLQAIDGERMAKEKKLWYSPAGDGGVLVFASQHADAPFDFVEKLAENCREKRIEIRLAVSEGTVVILGEDLPVGKAIMSTDKLCAQSACWQICARKTYFNGLPKTLRDRWFTTDAPGDGDAWLLSLSGSEVSGSASESPQRNLALAPTGLGETSDASLRRTDNMTTRPALQIVSEAVGSVESMDLPDVPDCPPSTPSVAPAATPQGVSSSHMTSVNQRKKAGSSGLASIERQAISDWVTVREEDLVDLETLAFTLRLGVHPICTLFTIQHARTWLMDQIGRFSGAESGADLRTLKQGLLEFLNSIIRDAEIFRQSDFHEKIVDGRTKVVAREQAGNLLRQNNRSAGCRLSRFILAEVLPESIRRIDSINILAERTANTEALEQFAIEREQELGFLVNFRLCELDQFDALVRGANDADIVLGYSYSLAPFASRQEVLSVEELKRIVKATPKVIESIRRSVLTASDLHFDGDVVDLFERQANGFKKELFGKVWRESSYYWGPGWKEIPLGLPFAAHTMLLVHNKQLFEAYSGDYERKFRRALLVPKDWSSFQEIVEFFDERGRSAPEKIWGVCMQGAKEGKWCYYEFLNFAYGDGRGVTEKVYGWHRNKVDRILLDSRETVNATQRYLRLTRMTYECGDTRYETCDHEKQIAAMLTGRVAMAIMWNDRLFNHFRERRDEFGFSVIPGEKSMIGAGTYFISRESANVHNACMFVAKTMSLDAQVELSRRGLCSVFREPYRRTDITQRLPWLEAVKLSLEQRRASRMLEGSWDAEQIAKLIMDTLHRLKANPSEDVEQVLTKAAEQIRSDISKSEMRGEALSIK